MQLLRSPNFVRLWLAIFVSTVGNFLLMLSLSVHMFQVTGTNFAAAAVFGTQWMAALFSAPVGGFLTTRWRAARLAAACETGGGAASLAVGAALGWLPAVFALLFLRGLAESIGKSARVVAMRDHLNEDIIERAASLIGTATFLGISLGSLAGAALVHVLGLPEIALIDAATFAVAAGLYLSLRDARPSPAAGAAPALRRVVGAGFAAMRAHPAVAHNVCYMVIATAFFQGFHNIARALLPIAHLQMGEHGVMLLQALASVSFFAGALVVALLMQNRQAAGRAQPWMLCAAAAALMLASVLTTDRAPSLLAYCAYLLLFEICFVFCQKNVVTLCPRGDLGLVSSLALSLSTLAMVVVIYAGGWMSDRIGLVPTALALFTAVLACMALVELKSPQGRRFAVAAPLRGDE